VKVLEELCSNDKCPRQDSHWHPFSIEDFLKESPGEYSVTLRVRTVRKSKEKRS